MAFNQTLGIRLARRHRDGVTIACQVRLDLLNTEGVLHGGVIATLADSSAGIALARHFRGQEPLTTVELKINYLSPATGGVVRARARLLRVGRTLCVARADVTDARGRAVATALVTYMLLRARGPVRRPRKKP